MTIVRMILFVFCFFLLTCHLSHLTDFLYAQDNIGKSINTVTGLAAKEEAIKREEERLKALRKEVDEKIEKYTKLLNELEEILRRVEAIQDETIMHIVKAYESMPPEEAAARLSVLDESTAIKILLKMRSRKAGVIIALIEPEKAASITKTITQIVKKFPTR